MKITINNKRVRFLTALIAITLLSSVILFSKREKTSFFCDESGWISSGYYYTELLLRRDFDWQKWVCAPCGPWGSRLNPHLGQWLIGIPLVTLSPKGEPTFFNLYNWKQSFPDNKKEKRVPPRQTLLRARISPVVFGTLSCLVIFVIGYYVSGLWVGLIAVFFLLTHNLFLKVSTQAMTDIFYNFFLLCGCLASVLLLKLNQKFRLLSASLMCGVLAGLASSVKITGVIIGGLLFLCVVLYKKRISGLTKKDLTTYITTFSFSAIVIIYLLNPFFWPSFKNIDVKSIVQEARSLYEEVIHKKFSQENFSARYPQLSNLARPLEFPYMFIRWNNFMNEQVGRRLANWHENRLVTFHKKLLGSFSTFFLKWIFFYIGITLCIVRMIASLRNRKLFLWSIPLFYFAVNYFFILLLKLNWNRYFLPSIMASGVIIAGGVYESIIFIYHYLCQKKYLPQDYNKQ
jgi:4-amino-4-deoxy-L-arabinose transferase-like glycosyltransferase